MSTLPSLRDMLDNGVHFGHTKSRWSPRMKRYIYTTRDNIHIIDLEKTRQKLDEALNFLSGVAQHGGAVLFVGTKRQAKDLVKEAAIACNMPYMSERWFGGTLTNFAVVRGNVKELEKIEQAEAKGEFAHLTKKERLRIEEKKRKLLLTLEGLRALQKLPQALVVVDAEHEGIAVKEAANLGIPVVGLVDTNANPDLVAYPVPANDDAAKSIALILKSISEAIKSSPVTAAPKAPEVATPVAEAAPAEESKPKKKAPVTKKEKAKNE